MSTDAQIRYSVVIPNHNYGRWMGGALDSVLKDSYSNKQIAVVDDGSTDDSWSTICSLLKISVKTKPGMVLTGSYKGIPCMAFRSIVAGGPSQARNIGIKMLWEHTDLYGFLDADDEYRDGKITKSIEKFKQDQKNIGAIYTDYDTVDENNILRTEYKEPFNRERLLRECIVHSACAVSKLALETCGLYDETLRVGEDYDQWLRISEKFCMVHIPETLMMVRIHSQNSTNTVKKEIWNECLKKIMLKTQTRNGL